MVPHSWSLRHFVLRCVKRSEAWRSRRCEWKQCQAPKLRLYIFPHFNSAIKKYKYSIRMWQFAFIDSIHLGKKRTKHKYPNNEIENRIVGQRPDIRVHSYWTWGWNAPTTCPNKLGVKTKTQTIYMLCSFWIHWCGFTNPMFITLPYLGQFPRSHSVTRDIVTAETPVHLLWKASVDVWNSCWS